MFAICQVDCFIVLLLGGCFTRMWEDCEGLSDSVKN